MMHMTRTIAKIAFTVAIVFTLLNFSAQSVQALTCGAVSDAPIADCSCEQSGVASGVQQFSGANGAAYCCGWVRNNVCLAQIPIDENITEGVGTEFFNQLNPLKIAGGDSIQDTAPSQYASSLSTPGGIITRTLDFAFPIAGLILFVMLVWSGFEIVIGASEKKAMDAGRQRATAAVVGFLLLFASYWLAQLVAYVFGIVIF